MRPERSDDIEDAIAHALTQVRELAAHDALPPVLRPLLLIAPPRGFHVDVELTTYTDHARERDEPQDDRWDARNGEVHLAYEPARDAPMRERSWRPDGERGPPPSWTPPDPGVALRDVIRAIARAEADPAFSFLALKFLRDQILPRSVAWAANPQETQIQINRAIDAGAILTGKVENPRAPQYPVTTVELNREHDAVREVLAALGDAQPPPDDRADDDAPDSAEDGPDDDSGVPADDGPRP